MSVEDKASISAYDQALIAMAGSVANGEKLIAGGMYPPEVPPPPSLPPPTTKGDIRRVCREYPSLDSAGLHGLAGPPAFQMKSPEFLKQVDHCRVVLRRLYKKKTPTWRDQSCGIKGTLPFFWIFPRGLPLGRNLVEQG